MSEAVEIQPRGNKRLSGLDHIQRADEQPEQSGTR